MSPSHFEVLKPPAEENWLGCGWMEIEHQCKELKLKMHKTYQTPPNTSK